MEIKDENKNFFLKEWNTLFESGNCYSWEWMINSHHSIKRVNNDSWEWNTFANKEPLAKNHGLNMIITYLIGIDQLMKIFFKEIAFFYKGIPPNFRNHLEFPKSNYELVHRNMINNAKERDSYRFTYIKTGRLKGNLLVIITI